MYCNSLLCFYGFKTHVLYIFMWGSKAVLFSSCYEQMPFKANILKNCKISYKRKRATLNLQCSTKYKYK